MYAVLPVTFTLTLSTVEDTLDNIVTVVFALYVYLVPVRLELEYK